MKIARIVSAIVVLMLMVYVVLFPNVVYAPTPKIILYFLASSFLAILIGAEASTRFELKLPGFIGVTTGAAALCLITLVTLTHLSKPEQQIAVYNLYDEQDNAVNLNWDGAFTLPSSPTGVIANNFIKGNTLILIFPEQLASQQIRVRKTSDGKEYVGLLTYAGNRQANINLGKDLK